MSSALRTAINTGPMHVVLKESKATLALALPIIVGQLSQMLIGLTDSVMVGRVGTVPLAASAFAGTLYAVVYIVAIGLLVPVSVLVSRARGAEQDKDAEAWVRHGMALGVAVGVVGLGAMAILGTQLHRFGQSPEVLAAVQPYYLIIAASILPSMVFQVLRQYAEALGHPWMPMALIMGGVGLNAFLNWVFIWGHFGLPAMGLAGAGWATLIARMLSALALYVWLSRHAAFASTWPYRRGHGGWFAGLSGMRFREMAAIGVPAAGMLLFESGAFSAAAVMVGWLGPVPLAAHQIALTCAAFTFMVPLGLSTAVSLRLSRAVGAGERASLRPIGFGALGMAVSFMALGALLFALGGRLLASGFVDDPAVVELAARLLVVAAIFQLFDGVQVVGAGALRGLSDVKIPTVITLIAYWGLALPGGYVIGIRAGYGAVGVWASLAAGLAFAAVFLALRFRRLTRA